MVSTKICLLLGKNKETFGLKKTILKKKWKVICKNKVLKQKDVKKIDLIITFNYRHVISKKILKKLKRPAINLHISYLPFNRGCHPNFWSFVENTVHGVTIHEVDSGIDTGNIIFQKKVTFNNLKIITFKNTHRKLIKEVELLFLKHIKKILNGKYKSKKQKKVGTFHSKINLPKNINWNIKISNYLISKK